MNERRVLAEEIMAERIGSIKEHPEIVRARKAFGGIYIRYTSGEKKVTPDDVYNAVVDLNKARLEYDPSMSEVERGIREEENKRYTLILEDSK